MACDIRLWPHVSATASGRTVQQQRSHQSTTDNGDFLWPTIQIPKVFPNMQISGDPNLISQNLEVFSYDPKSNIYIYIYLRDCTSSIFKYQYHMPKLEVPDKNRWWRWSWRVAAGDLLQASVEPGTSVYKLVAQLVDKRVGFQWGLNQ